MRVIGGKPLVTIAASKYDRDKIVLDNTIYLFKLDAVCYKNRIGVQQSEKSTASFAKSQGTRDNSEAIKRWLRDITNKPPGSSPAGFDRLALYNQIGLEEAEKQSRRRK